MNRIAWALVASSLLASAAHAADRPITQGEFVRAALAESAQCLLGTSPAAVGRFLTMFPGSKDAVRQAGYFNKSGCVQSASGAQDLFFAPESLRGAFYKIMYQHAYPQPTAEPLAAAPINFQLDAGAGDADQQRNYIVMRQFAECVVRKDPEASRALVLAVTESAAEHEAFRALRPDLDPCMVQGGSAQISRTALTGLIAETLYRLSPSRGSVPARG